MQTIFKKYDQNKRNLFKSAVLEDLNLVFLTAVFALAAALGAMVLAAGLALEVVYLAVLPGRAWYRASVEHRNHRDVPLLLLMMAGTLIILFFGFGLHQRLPALTHSQSWELGALCWTAVFGLYYWFRLGDISNQNAFRLAGLLILTLLPALNLIAAAFLWYDKQGEEHSLPFHFLHVICVALIGVVLLLTDWMLARYSKRVEQKRALYESVWVADIPIVAAFMVLIGFAALHQPCGDKDCPDLLLSGAITFQLIASNVLFILLQFDVLESIRVRIERAAAAAG